MPKNKDKDKKCCSSCCAGEGNAIISDDEWENLLLKLELDLRSQTFFFFSYLLCIKSLLNPDTRNLLKCEPIPELLAKIAKHEHGMRPCTISAHHLQRSANALAKEKKRVLAARRANKKFDYLNDYFHRSSHDIPHSILPEEYLSNFGGEPLYSIKVGPFVVQSAWLGQIRMKADSAAQTLDINIFRFNPHIPDDLTNLEHLRCEKVSQFMFCYLPRYEVSRLLRLSIPMDHIEGLHILKHPEYARIDAEDRQAILILDLIHPINFYTRRINCAQEELNKFKPRKDFGHASDVKRYFLSGTLASLSYVVATLQNVRPSFVCKYIRGVADVGNIVDKIFAADHPEPIDVSKEVINKSLSDDTIGKFLRMGIISPPIEGEDPLEDSYPCFRDFVYRVKDEQVVLESLEKEIPELDCKVKDYLVRQHQSSVAGREEAQAREDNVRTEEQEQEVKDHPEQSLPSEHQYYSFCFGRMCGEEFFHCYKCGNCAGEDHWHKHKLSPGVLYRCMRCKSDACVTRHPHPLSGKLNAPLCGGRYPMGSEDADASGVDDDDTPAWPTHTPSPIPLKDGLVVKDDLFIK